MESLTIVVNSLGVSGRGSFQASFFLDQYSSAYTVEGLYCKRPIQCLAFPEMSDDSDKTQKIACPLFPEDSARLFSVQFHTYENSNSGGLLPKMQL